MLTSVEYWSQCQDPQPSNLHHLRCYSSHHDLSIFAFDHVLLPGVLLEESGSL